MNTRYSVGDLINTKDGTILKVTHINAGGLYSLDEWEINELDNFRFVGERVLTLREIRALEAKV